MQIYLAIIGFFSLCYFSVRAYITAMHWCIKRSKERDNLYKRVADHEMRLNGNYTKRTELEERLGNLTTKVYAMEAACKKKK